MIDLINEVTVQGRHEVTTNSFLEWQMSGQIVAGLTTCFGHGSPEIDDNVVDKELKKRW